MMEYSLGGLRIRYYVRPNRSPNSRHASRTRNFHGVISPPRLRTVRESQRDSAPKPRVARNELPWVIVRQTFPTATRLWPIHSRPRAWPWPQRRWRCFHFRTRTQGRRWTPTLGWRSQSLWDCSRAHSSIVRRGGRLRILLRRSRQLGMQSPSERKPSATTAHFCTPPEEFVIV